MEEGDRFNILFAKFSRFGRTQRPSGEIGLSNLIKWMVQTRVIPKLLHGVDVFITFKAKAERRHTMSFAVFKEALRFLAATRNISVEEIILRLMNCDGPLHNRTTKMCNKELVNRLYQPSYFSSRHICDKCMKHNHWRRNEVVHFPLTITQDSTCHLCNCLPPILMNRNVCPKMPREWYTSRSPTSTAT